MNRMRAWLGMRPVQLGLVAVLAVSLAAGGWVALGGSPTPSPSPTPQPTPTPSPTATPSPSPTPSPTPEPTPRVLGYCPFSGRPIMEGDDEISPIAFAVQVENHPLARPTLNLGRADMVIEATVEGDVTRFTAIFQCQATTGLTGPVRSARYYTIDVWQSLHVLPVFFGAQREARDRFAAAGMPYVNGIFGEWPGRWFPRAGPNPAPHNLYVDLELIRSSLGSNAALDVRAEAVGPPRPPLTFSSAAALPPGRPVSTIEIMTNSYWRFGWAWDEESSTWLRSEGGEPSVDGTTDEPLRAPTVLVQQVVETIDYEHLDPGGSPRRVHQLVGRGRGMLYISGERHRVRWSRPAADAATTWTYAESRQPVELPPGVIWWEIVPTYATITEG